MTPAWQPCRARQDRLDGRRHRRSTRRPVLCGPVGRHWWCGLLLLLGRLAASWRAPPRSITLASISHPLLHLNRVTHNHDHRNQPHVPTPAAPRALPCAPGPSPSPSPSPPRSPSLTISVAVTNHLSPAPASARPAGAIAASHTAAAAGSPCAPSACRRLRLLQRPASCLRDPVRC
ncbi:uncharacterized protein BDZ99DRAFT_81836 [Mytilinidion resinicola]|uniref:Uncharacterized protein n=1 Tax=Mytilinidion resinicola TaxID=574789 RepID=A0A6A6YDH2_9PEZI|nr:uncharacterized protein BDZ99DRAFT_81836 [Mytilinidion resinicola]KAF2806608.1 hypothetical protein BDZ99DRAFT_81836 [Mytilinidion resinicola]